MMKWQQKYLTNRAGFSLPELLFSLVILLPLFAGAMLVLVRCLALNELSVNTSSALLAVRNRMHDIENTAFNQIIANYHQQTFTSPDLAGTGVSYVQAISGDLLTVTVSFCWQEANGRLMGEDADLDGVLDFGEDLNGNNMLDSPVTIATVIYDK